MKFAGLFTVIAMMLCLGACNNMHKEPMMDNTKSESSYKN